MIGLVLLAALATQAQELKTATTHPIQYYVSLPNGFQASARRWPVVMIIEAADRQFSKTLDMFVKARKDRPFILVAPLVTTNGGPNYRQSDTYHYSEDVWAQIKQDRCGFDFAGINAVAADVRKLYNTEERYFLTAWEAGGHTAWPIILQHPESLKAAAPAVTNYLGRCLEPSSPSPTRRDLPVTVFQVDSGRERAPGRYVYQQSQDAMRAAKERGFTNVTERLVTGKPHGPLADEVLDYFGQFLGK